MHMRRHASSYRPGYGGACIAAKPTPILGWYSPGLGRRVPAFSLLGRGRCVPGTPLATRLEFLEAGKSSEAAVSRRPVSWRASGAQPGKAPEIQAEAR